MAVGRPKKCSRGGLAKSGISALARWTGADALSGSAARRGSFPFRGAKRFGIGRAPRESGGRLRGGGSSAFTNAGSTPPGTAALGRNWGRKAVGLHRVPASREGTGDRRARTFNGTQQDSHLAFAVSR